MLKRLECVSVQTECNHCRNLKVEDNPLEYVSCTVVNAHVWYVVCAIVTQYI